MPGGELQAEDNCAKASRQEETGVLGEQQVGQCDRSEVGGVEEMKPGRWQWARRHGAW